MSAPGGERTDAPLNVFIVAGEASGDVLGADLMRRLLERATRPVSFRGVGGARMQAEGLHSLFPMQDLEAIGIVHVVRKLPRLLRRLREVVTAILAEPPDILVLIDAPDFTHRVAARVRAANPAIPIVKYVSPTVWAWRPGRARAMRPYTDLVLALLPFEPDVHRKLGGPDCVYVGHPLLGRLADLRPAGDEAALREASPPTVLALPGSRRQEIAQLGFVFGDALARAAQMHGPLEVILPTVPHLAGEVARIAEGWPLKPQIVTADADKHAAFRRARAALAASGTVTLELALARVPHVVAYKVSSAEYLVARMMLLIDSIALPNLILGDRLVPELLQENCSADALASALSEVLGDTATRQRQLAGFARLDSIMSAQGTDPSTRAAEAVLGLAGRRGAAGYLRRESGT